MSSMKFVYVLSNIWRDCKGSGQYIDRTFSTINKAFNHFNKYSEKEYKGMIEGKEFEVRNMNDSNFNKSLSLKSFKDILSNDYGDLFKPAGLHIKFKALSTERTYFTKEYLLEKVVVNHPW